MLIVTLLLLTELENLQRKEAPAEFVFSNGNTKMDPHK